MVLKPLVSPAALSWPFDPPKPVHDPAIQITIQTFTADLVDIQSFLSISFSSSRSNKIEELLVSTLASLSENFDFDLLHHLLLRTRCIHH